MTRAVQGETELMFLLFRVTWFMLSHADLEIEWLGNPIIAHRVRARAEPDRGQTGDD